MQGWVREQGNGYLKSTYRKEAFQKQVFFEILIWVRCHPSKILVAKI